MVRLLDEHSRGPHAFTWGLFDDTCWNGITDKETGVGSLLPRVTRPGYGVMLPHASLRSNVAALSCSAIRWAAAYTGIAVNVRRRGPSFE